MGLDLRIKVEEKLKEAEIQTKKINTAIDLFEETFKQITTRCLRSKLIQEINSITNKILKEASTKEIEFKTYTILYADKVVGVQAIRTENRGLISFDISVIEMKKDSFDHVARKMRQEYPMMRIMSLEEFELKSNNLRSAISNGRMDHILHASGGQALWEVITANKAPS